MKCPCCGTIVIYVVVSYKGEGRYASLHCPSCTYCTNGTPYDGAFGNNFEYAKEALLRDDWMSDDTWRILKVLSIPAVSGLAQFVQLQEQLSLQGEIKC